MWNKTPKKCVFTLNIGGTYAPDLCALTYPLIQRYADKIGASFFVIKERKFPDFAPVYEKLQIYQLAQEMENDWNIYIDSDALVHPDLFDITNLISKDTVVQNGVDHAGNRWLYDRFFYRDGRNLGACNWFTIASDWCIELWKPLDDLTQEEATARINPTVNELTAYTGHDDPNEYWKTHLIDDYTLSRNIAKYGLKYKTMADILQQIKQPQGAYLYHEYTIPIPEKINRMKSIMAQWGIRKMTEEDGAPKVMQMNATLGAPSRSEMVGVKQ